MLLVSLAGVACGLILARMPIGADAPMLQVFVMLTVAGAHDAVMVSSLCARGHLYPAEIRTTGIGAAVAFGRVGAVLSARRGPPCLIAAVTLDSLRWCLSRWSFVSLDLH